jgi:hypothetical protein
MLSITWITGDARHRQDFPWLFFTPCEYKQYGIHLAMQPLHLEPFNKTTDQIQNTIFEVSVEI